MSDGEALQHVPEAEEHEITFIYTGQHIQAIPRNITHLQVHPSVRRIEDSAFENCQELRSVTVPSTMEAIGDRAFVRCVSLVDVHFHEGLKSIGLYAFYKCSSLLELELPDGITQIEHSTFVSCLSLRTISLPISVVRIGTRAFSQCDSLTDISLPKRLKRIETQAFARCKALSSVVFPSSLEFVGNQAFLLCKNLLYVEIPSCSNNIGIGSVCFGNDESLVNLSTPRAVANSVFKGSRIHKSKLALVQERFSALRIHDLCYRSSTLTRDQIMEVLDDSSGNLLDESLLKDGFEMTPFHVLASSASLNLEILNCLLERYPIRILHHKDCYDYTMMDYLLKHTSPRAVPLLHLVLRHAVINTVATWHPIGKWASDLSLLIEWIPVSSDVDRRGQFVKASFLHAGYFSQIEITSLLELAVWKTKTRSIQALEESKNNDIGWKESCRYQSGAGVVIENVVRYLWHDEACVDTGLSLFPLCSTNNF